MFPYRRLVILLFALFVAVDIHSRIGMALAQSQTEATDPSLAQPYPNRPFVDRDRMYSTAAVQPQPEPFHPSQTGAAQSLGVSSASPQAQTTYWWGIFQSYRNGNWEIYRVRGSGVDFAQLTHHPAADTLPRFNADVTQVVFVSERDGNPEIYGMAADGANQRRLTADSATDTMPTWSPDSTQILFVSDRSGNADLYMMEATGNNIQPLTTDPALDLFPDWSPDGTQLVWVRASGEVGWLWAMNRDGSNARAISGPLRYLQHPRWSPDGRNIAFDYDTDNDGFSEIGLLTVATGAIQSVNDLSPAAPVEGRDLRMNAWTPTGDGIQFSYFAYSWQDIDGKYKPFLRDMRTDGFCVVERCNLLYVSLFGNDSDSDLYLDVRSSDMVPPISKVDPLPQFRRFGSLFVSWTASDPGGSGAVLYDVDYRTDLESAWQSWLNHGYVVGDYFNQGTPGNIQRLYFRSRAIDDAENVEAWPVDPKGDTSVTLYATTISGQVTDLRGIGRAGQKLPMLPAGMTEAKTDTVGDYFVRLPANGEYQINGLRITTNADRVQSFYLDPPQTLIKNGDFEAFTILDKWLPGGTITPTLTISNVSSGLQGAHLGYDCAYQCVTVDMAAPDPGEGGSYYPLWTADGHLHLFFSPYDPAGASKVYYSAQLAPDLWSEPIALVEGSANRLQAVGDQNGNLFVAMPANLATGNTIVTIAYTSGEGWGPATPFDGGESPQLAIGGDGSLHLLYLQQCAPNCWESSLVYRWRSAQGSWSSPIVVSGEGYDEYRLLVGKDNIAHLFWYEQNKRFKYSNGAPRLLNYQTYRQGRPLRPAMILDAQEIFNLFDLDPQDTLIAFGAANSGLLYTDTPLNNRGTESPYIVNSYQRLVTWSVDGTLHLLAPDHASGAPWHYTYKAQDRRWSTPQPIQLNEHFPKWLHIDGAGQFRAVTYTGKQILFPPKIAAGSSMLAQSVTLPADLHAPTLSWMAETQGGPQGISSFAVTISDALSSTLLYSTTATAPWQLQWADLTPWLGQTITVTFAVSQADGDIPFRVFLDHIALGEWTTPVPQMVTPPQVEAGIGKTLVISGENFMATPQITLGGKPLTNVRLLSATTLEATVPSSLSPGIYDLVVTNPKGAATVLPGAVKVGKQLYLPLLYR